MTALFKIWGCIISIACLTLPGYCSGKTPLRYPGNSIIAAMDSLYHLTLHEKDVAQAVHQDMLLHHKYRFVQINVVKVQNPQNYPLIFYVYYQYPNNQKVLLNSFSLYPPDKPGSFIVATHGKIDQEGSIILSLTSPAKIKAGDKPGVDVKKFILREK